MLWRRHKRAGRRQVVVQRTGGLRTMAYSPAALPDLTLEFVINEIKEVLDATLLSAHDTTSTGVPHWQRQPI
jgi:hypothetical protein